MSAAVNPRERGVRIAPHFLGLSYEVEDLNGYSIGNPLVGVNPGFVNLVGAITAQGSGAPVLRVGGGSADATWWNPTGARLPPGLSLNLNPFYLGGLRAAQQATGMPVIFGLNFGRDDPALAAAEVRAVQSSLPAGALQGFELGNEPDLYTRVFGGRRQRHPGWNFARYLSDFARFVRVLRRIHPRPVLVAPNSCCAEFARGLPRLLRRFRRDIGAVSYHLYPASSCGRPPRPRQLLRDLLGQPALSFSAGFIAPLVARARRFHRPVRLGETNSDACAGAGNGVSDRYAAALWSVDWSFVMASLGVRGLNFHTSGLMAPFLSIYTYPGWRTTVFPLYYGLLTFAEATANNGRLLLRTTFLAHPRRGVPVHVFATADRAGTVRVLVLDKDAHRGGNASIRIHGASRVGTVSYLRGPALTSRTDVTLGGQSFGPDGRPLGVPVKTLVRPRAGVYRFLVPPASAALLTVTRGSG